MSNEKLSIVEFTKRYAAAVVTKGTDYDPTKQPFRPHFGATLVVGTGSKGPITARYLRVVDGAVQYFNERVTDALPISFLNVARARGYSEDEINSMVAKTGKGAYVTGHLPPLTKGAGRTRVVVDAKPLACEW